MFEAAVCHGQGHTVKNISPGGSFFRARILNQCTKLHIGCGVMFRTQGLGRPSSQYSYDTVCQNILGTQSYYGANE